VAVGEVDGHPIVVSGGGDSTVRVWDPAAGGNPRVIRLDVSVYSVTKPKNNLVVIGHLAGLTVSEFEARYPRFKPLPDYRSSTGNGIDGLSMRRLSEEVGRDPTVLYRHIPNKAALLDGVAEIVIGQLRVDTADPDWVAQLRIVAHDFRRLALAHPNVVPLLVTRPLATPLGQRPPGMLRPLEDVLALLNIRRLQRGRRPTHLPGALRLRVWPHPHRVAGGRRATRGDRRCPAPRPTPANDHRVPPGARAGLRPGILRRRRRTRPRPRSFAHRPHRHPDTPRRVTAIQMRRRVALGLGGLPSLPAARGYGREFSVCNSEASQLTPQHDLTRALTVRAGHAYSPVMVERIETVLAGTGPLGLPVGW
jgi:AcrR family transcriptional regulator